MWSDSALRIPVSFPAHPVWSNIIVVTAGALIFCMWSIWSEMCCGDYLEVSTPSAFIIRLVRFSLAKVSCSSVFFLSAPSGFLSDCGHTLMTVLTKNIKTCGCFFVLLNIILFLIRVMLLCYCDVTELNLSTLCILVVRPQFYPIKALTVNTLRKIVF